MRVARPSPCPLAWKGGDYLLCLFRANLNETTRQRYRIAFCTTELRSGGAERCLVELATRLPYDLFTCTVVSLSPRPQANERSLVPRLEEAGIPIHFLNARRATDAWKAVRDLTQVWRQQPPDLVQTLLFHANVIGCLAASRAGVRHVVTGIRVAERRARWRLWLERLATAKAARHVCVSESVATFMRDVARLPADRIEVIPNGIEVTSYANVSPAPLESLGLPPGRRMVVCVGRLDPQKGQRWLLENARSWLDRLPEHDLVLVGDGPDRAALESLTRTLNIQNRVHLVGWRKDVRAILVASELLVLPSKWEGMPNVVLETMAAGRPVVARDVEGVRELLGPGAMHQVTAFDDPQLFSRQVVAILSGPALRDRLAKENRARATSEFPLESMVERYGRLYRKLLNG